MQNQAMKKKSFNHLRDAADPDPLCIQINLMTL